MSRNVLIIGMKRMQHHQRLLILLLGSNRGIGLSLAREFHENGWTVTGSVRPQSRSDAETKEVHNENEYVETMTNCFSARKHCFEHFGN